MPYIGVNPVERASMVLTQGTLGSATDTIPVPGGYTPSNIAVYVNGLRLKTSDYTASDGFNITLNETFASGSEYVIEEFRSFEVADVGASQVTTSTGTQSLDVALDRRAIYVDTIAALQAMDAEVGQTVYLTEEGRAGEFVVKTGTPPSDPQEGIYIGLGDDKYAERLDSNIHIGMFGASGDGATPDNTAALAMETLLGYVALEQGKSYAFNTLTLSGDLIVPKSSVVVPLTGQTVSLDGDVVAGHYQIFDTTDGDVALTTTYEIKAEWFAAAYFGQSQIVRGKNAGKGAVGNSAGVNYSHFDGFRAAEQTTASIEDTFIGNFAGSSANDTQLTTAVGYGALRGKEDPAGSGTFNATTAQQTTAIGTAACQDGTSHTGTTAVGSGAFRNAPTTQNSVALGTNVGRLSGSLQDVTLIGSGTGYNFGTTGLPADSQYMTVIGRDAIYNTTQGYRSTLVGARTGNYSSICDRNTWLGYLTGPDSATYSNVSDSICIGDAARTRANNTITIGNAVTSTVEGQVYIGDSSTSQFSAQGIYNSTTPSASNVVVDSNGRLYRSTSSLKYKEVIEPMTLDWAKKVLMFEPILYKPTDNQQEEGWTYYGFGAEQVASIDPRYVHMEKPITGYDDDTGQPVLGEDREPSGVMYERLVVAQNELIKDLYAQLEQVRSEIEQMRGSDAV